LIDYITRSFESAFYERRLLFFAFDNDSGVD